MSSDPVSRLVAGLMSGTSLDGVDAVVARLTGSGPAIRIEPLAFVSIPYPPALRALLLRNSAPETSSVLDLSQLNVRLAHVYAGAVRRVVAEAGLTVEALDLVGSHGQTVHHVPDPADCAGQAVTSTLQIGDPSVLANLLGVPVVGDFRLADMALGGQGAPLVPYFDYVCFADARETRGLLNVGGIANITVLPAGAGPEAVFAFDTGPGNMVIDALAQRLLGRPYDAAGAVAAQGTIDNAVLADLLSDPFFAQPPPRSTGRERFGAAFVDRLLGRMTGRPAADVLATATMLTAAAVYQAYARFIRPAHALDALIVSGGGVHNAFLLQKLADSFAPIPVRPTSADGVDPDAKEALCFAVLAHETMNRVPTSLPRVTGARRPALLGKICLPD
ncbi:MAG: anhydro-N-acetylmuramic acid kinase [Bacteroidetes bacterium]|nr:MAG: anhydro-N-acetylmuramic acid kinase [Bacteroidota bacterium]